MSVIFFKKSNTKSFNLLFYNMYALKKKEGKKSLKAILFCLKKYKFETVLDIFCQVKVINIISN